MSVVRRRRRRRRRRRCRRRCRRRRRKLFLVDAIAQILFILSLSNLYILLISIHR